MLIDWFTVGAQALNFIVLLWLMKRFLYQPIQAAIASREKFIADELSDADAKRVEAQKERDDYQGKNAAFDQDRAALLDKAVSEAAAERTRLMEAARSAADTLAARRREALSSEAGQLARALRQRTRQEVFAIARKTLAELSTKTLEASACDVFVQRLRSLDAAGRAALAASLAAAGQKALVRSAFDLPEAQRDALQAAIDAAGAKATALQFETAPDLVAGIELGVGGYKFAWSISDHLDSMDRGVGELLSDPRPSPQAP